MSDSILRASAAEGSVRIFVANTKNLVQAARMAHGTSPVMTAALGRTLTAGAIMGSMLKNDKDILTINIKGDGPGGGITVTADSRANVKGYAYNPGADLPLTERGKLDVQGALGYGTLTVIKDLGLKEPYCGQVPLLSGEIAEDITYYFAKSEQVPSAVALGVLVDRDRSVKQAGGFIIQMMPGASEEIISTLEERLKKTDSITKLLESGKTNEDILNLLAEGMEPKILSQIPTVFKCDCSKERVEKALLTIGKKEIAKIIEETGQTTLHCHFCNKNYTFNKDELLNLLQNG